MQLEVIHCTNSKYDRSQRCKSQASSEKSRVRCPAIMRPIRFEGIPLIHDAVVLTGSDHVSSCIPMYMLDDHPAAYKARSGCEKGKGGEIGTCKVRYLNEQTYL